MTLNPNAESWVEALESGKYKQGKQQLRDGDKFCCMGVACELAVAAGVIESYDPYLPLPPHTVSDWLGLRTSGGEYITGRTGQLTADNDDGASFTEIAAIIRSEPFGLLKDAA